MQNCACGIVSISWWPHGGGTERHYCDSLSRWWNWGTRRVCISRGATQLERQSLSLPPSLPQRESGSTHMFMKASALTLFCHLLLLRNLETQRKLSGVVSHRLSHKKEDLHRDQCQRCLLICWSATLAHVSSGSGCCQLWCIWKVAEGQTSLCS
jgi:hypothetical protein